MKLKLYLKTVSWVLASALLCSACQSWIPKAQGLATPEWAAQNYQRQDQIEVQWKSQSFSFYCTNSNGDSQRGIWSHRTAVIQAQF
jgi:hypothetical protein